MILNKNPQGERTQIKFDDLKKQVYIKFDKSKNLKYNRKFKSNLMI
ncbi:MAG: hypothetical protein K5978_04575 [Campylobacter sp.]|nr:hypothetical protein [Campylobacter sp.]